jgi:hypothetical protein
MGPPSYLRSVVDRNVVMQRIPVVRPAVPVVTLYLTCYARCDCDARV